MIAGIRLKVCGLTSLVDAECADAIGADYLGFILYPKSPRYVPLESFKAMASRLPPRKKVAVVVEPSTDELVKLIEAGFDFVQLHFSNDTSFFQMVSWTEAIPHDRIWLAPRVPPGKEIDTSYFPLTNTVLMDGYHTHVFGGTGHTADWKGFAELQSKFTRVEWVLAGGLNAENIGAALKQSQARFVDVNSGVEVSPGVKDHAKLKAFAEALRAASTQ